MRLRGVDFGFVWGASGVQGFFGEGYWFHKLWRPFGLDLNRLTFVAKTTTLNPRVGNMPLNGDFTPKELFPRCVVVKPLKGVVLNSVALSGPGAEGLFQRGLWQRRTRPFLISFMSVADNPAKRLDELKQFVALFKIWLTTFRAPVGLQMNYSCPNTGHALEELAGEIGEGLNIASELGIPLIPKLSVVLPVETAAVIASHRFCDAIHVSNTVPFGQLADRIDWKKFFGSNGSPLAHLGGGGLSGWPLLPLVRDWVWRARKYGLKKPINAGGGILSVNDAWSLTAAGAESISIGSVVILRPWRVKKIIKLYCYDSNSKNY